MVTSLNGCPSVDGRPHADAKDNAEIKQATTMAVGYPHGEMTA